MLGKARRSYQIYMLCLAKEAVGSDVLPLPHAEVMMIGLSSPPRLPPNNGIFTLFLPFSKSPHL